MLDKVSKLTLKDSSLLRDAFLSWDEERESSAALDDFAHEQDRKSVV